MAKKVAEEEALSTTLAVVSKRPLNDWADSVKDNYDFSHNIVFFIENNIYFVPVPVPPGVSVNLLNNNMNSP